MKFRERLNRLSTDCMKLMRSAAMWLVWNVPLGKFAPVLMGFALQRKPHFKGYRT